MRNKMEIIKRGLLIFLTVSLSACSTFMDTKPEGSSLKELQSFYVIDVDRGLKESTSTDAKVLYVAPVRVTSQFRHKSLVYKVENNAFQPQPDHQFFDSPEEMFRTQLQRWLEKTGIFSSVITDNEHSADLILETAVTSLYGVKISGHRPQSIIEMQFFLTDPRLVRDDVIFQTGLSIDIDIAEITPPNVVKGWQIGFKKLLSTLEDDLSGYFHDYTP